MPPSIFHDLPIRVACSNLKHGTMKLGGNKNPESVIANRRQFLHSSGISLEATTLLSVEYGDNVAYTRILDVDKSEPGKGMLGDETPSSDALFTSLPRQALFLPLADCGGVFLFDTKQRVLGLLHLGRHATLEGLAKKSVEHMRAHYGTSTNDIYVWISPAISGESYWLSHFDGKSDKNWQPHIRADRDGHFVDLQGYNVDAFVRAGVPENQIERSPINTAADARYPSHYVHQTLGQPGKAGRFAVVAYIK